MRNADEELRQSLYDQLFDKYYEVAQRTIAGKKERRAAFNEVRDAYYESLPEEHELDEFLIKQYIHEIEKKASRKLVLDKNIRLDGRQTDEVRNIWCDVDYLPGAHGSAVFTRGETQSLTTVTLGTKMDEQMIDGAMHEGSNKFILHYNFPGFSTGEVKPNRGPRPP